MLKRACWFGVASALAAPALAALSWTGCQGTCASSDECGEGELCSMATGVCLLSRAIGFCKPAPESCPAVAQTVCGCDGKTYANSCEASRARQAVAAEGACKVACGGPAHTKCAAGTFCRFGDGSCGTAEAVGECEPIPGSCATAPSAPVCGCDGKTYPSRCAADAAGVSVIAAGTCACGGAQGVACEDGKFCNYAVGSCAQASPSGACEAPPAECAAFSSPVCGCDYQTYDNACEAAKAEVSVYADGPCPCGGAAQVDCPDGYYCDFGATGSCLEANPTGSCAAVPESCSGVAAQVCGCDGVTYLNACSAAQAGVSVASVGACAPLPDGGADGG